jgi:hypothetical protein
MTEAETILKMIESVDTADSAKLDEIDMAVEQFIQQKKLQFRFRDRGDLVPAFSYAYDDGHGNWMQVIGTAYTRSRDALKEIRPEGWEISMSEKGQWCDLWKKDMKWHCVAKEINLYSEELAELHVIIQAIAFERGSLEMTDANQRA